MQNNKLNFLVIEDNPGDFMLVEEFLLERFDRSELTLATSFAGAKQFLGAGPLVFDFILLDISLPDKTGEPLIREMLEICKGIPVIVLTGFTDFNFGVRSLSMGVADYILKEELTPGLLQKTILYAAERKRITDELERSEKRVRSFAQQLNNAIEEERARIAREIHDEFGQQLTGIKMSLSLLKRFKGSKEDIDPVINTALVEIDESINSLRLFANELRPAILDKIGLFAAIEWLVNQWNKKCKVNFNLEMHVGTADGLDNKSLEINIFRICQEALTNIVKHAKASEAEVMVSIEGSGLTVKITDNGIGIQLTGNQLPVSMGLLNMSERATIIGGELYIGAPFNGGTCIELRVNNYDKENTDCR